MNDVEELKRYVEVHARGQRIAGYRDVLARIRNDGSTGPGSWVAQWSRVARRLEYEGRDLEASRHYAMARFPFVDGPARQEAQDRCVAALARWQEARQLGLRRLDVPFAPGTVPCWTSGLSSADRLPLLLIMGGIVTVKEQWAPVLAWVRRLGMAGIVMEMPGVGQNPARYGAESWRMISAVLDAVADRALADQTYALALSFSGHMALRCAMDDPRIRGVVTVGAPVSEFFTNASWQRQVPGVTRDTLAHLTGVEPGRLPGSMDDFALTGRQLSGLGIPVAYVASRQDEIIPLTEAGRLRNHVRRTRFLHHDDVHGAPRHVAETQIWCLRSLLWMRGVRGARGAAVELLWQGARARGRVTRGMRPVPGGTGGV